MTPDGTPVQTPSTALSIQGVDFSLPPRYAPGHVCTAAEAEVLNLALRDHLRTNFAKQVRAFLKGPQTASALDSLRATFAHYAATYVLGAVTRRRKALIDPIEREAARIAKIRVQEQARAKGYDPATFTKEQLDKLVSDLVAKDPQIRAEAERRIQAARAVAAEAIAADERLHH